MVSADGLTVTDMITGLVWQREGSGARPGCSGTSQLTCSWSEAQTYCAGLTLSGLSDWRLPALKELSTIVEPNLPSIDPTAFPGTPETTFWTSTQQDQLPTPIVSVVDFDGGSCGVITEPPALAIALGLQFDYHVRCVVGSRCYPTSRFVVLAGGLAQDTLTGLVWQQDGSGTRAGCSGSGNLTCTWAEAQAYCTGLGSGFRLPTVRELLSIVDFTVASELPINPDLPVTLISHTAFPNTPAEEFWTSSPTADSSGDEFIVTFDGGESYGSAVGDDYRVRCVR